MQNPFDNPGLSDAETLGFLKKIAKKVKKAVKKVTPLAAKVGKEVKRTGKKIDKNITRKVVKEVKRSPVAQVATVAAAAMIFPPAAAAIKGAAAKVGLSKAAVGAAVKKAAISTVKSKAVGAVAKKVVQQRIDKKQAAAAKKLDENFKRIEQINAAVRSDPAFAQVVAKMQAAGASEADIVKAWAQSDKFRSMAQPVVERVVYDEVSERLSSAGVPDSVIQQQAAVQSKVVADQVLNEAQEKAGQSSVPGWVLPAAAAGLSLLLFGG